MDISKLSHLETSTLISFIEVAKRGSFTEAANALHLSQPTVSQQVRRLEKLVGAKLLHRRSNKVYLSPAGETFISHCQVGLQNIETGILSALRISATTSEAVTLGITCVNAQRCLSKVLTLYHKQNPHVQIHISEGMPYDLVCSLQAQTIDLAVLSLPAPVDTLSFIPLYEEPLWLIVAATHELASIEKVTWKDICAHPLILPQQEEEFGIRALIEALYRRHQSKIETTVEVNGSQALRQLLLSNYGIAFLPYSQFQQDLKDGLLVVKQPPECNLKHTVAIATYPKIPLSPAAQRLVNIMTMGLVQLQVSC